MYVHQDIHTQQPSEYLPPQMNAHQMYTPPQNFQPHPHYHPEMPAHGGHPQNMGMAFQNHKQQLNNNNIPKSPQLSMGPGPMNSAPGNYQQARPQGMNPVHAMTNNSFGPPPSFNPNPQERPAMSQSVVGGGVPSMQIRPPFNPAGHEMQFQQNNFPNGENSPHLVANGNHNNIHPAGQQLIQRPMGGGLPYQPPPNGQQMPPPQPHVGNMNAMGMVGGPGHHQPQQQQHQVIYPEGQGIRMNESAVDPMSYQQHQ